MKSRSGGTGTGLAGQHGRRRPLTIIMYHSIGDPPDRFTISPATLRRQLAFIKDHFPIIRLRYVPTLLATWPTQERRVAITFDDALLDFGDAAFPILDNLAIPATLFVPTAFIGGFNDWERRAGGHPVRKRVLGEDDLRALARTGIVDIGSHTVNHVRMSGVSTVQARRQAVASKCALESLVDRAVSTFAYPYGQLGDWSPTTEGLLREAGYELAVTTHWGTRNSSAELLRLHRIHFQERDRDRVLACKVNGWFDWVTLKERLAFSRRRWRGDRRVRTRTLQATDGCTPPSTAR